MWLAEVSQTGHMDVSAGAAQPRESGLTDFDVPESFFDPLSEDELAALE